MFVTLKIAPRTEKIKTERDGNQLGAYLRIRRYVFIKTHKAVSEYSSVKLVKLSSCYYCM